MAHSCFIEGVSVTNWCISSGWLELAERCPSPNFNSRPEGQSIELLVIHNISLPPGQFGGDAVKRFFQNQLSGDEHPFYQQIEGLTVSAHLLINRRGQVTQFVSFDQRAWHAGVSEFQGRSGCNDFSIGIEMEGTDTEPYTDSQYQVLAAVTKALQQHYPIANICGHSDIAPGRKTDPGEAFDWGRYRRLLGERE